MTIYAFSIENFKRTKYEVDALMDMAKTKLSQLAQHGELLERYGAKMQFLGQREMVRPDVLEAIDKAIALTSGNGRYAMAMPQSKWLVLTSIQSNSEHLRPIHFTRRDHNGNPEYSPRLYQAYAPNSEATIL